MNHLQSTTEHNSSLTIARLNLIGLAGRLFIIWRNRRETRDLLDLNDQLLADIGISRGTVREALLKGPASDPSPILNEERAHRAHRFYDKAKRVISASTQSR